MIVKRCGDSLARLWSASMSGRSETVSLATTRACLTGSSLQVDDNVHDRQAEGILDALDEVAPKKPGAWVEFVEITISSGW